MPDIKCSHSAVWNLDKFRANPRNPNRHSAEQLRLLAKVITIAGWRSPIVVSKRSGLVVKGHGRLEAAKLAGMTVAPVDEQDYADEAAEMADMIADNRLAELAEMDLPGLKDLLQEIDTGATDMELSGFTDMELERLMSQYHVEGENDAEKEWQGMPEYEGDDANGIRLIVHFKDMEDRAKFASLIGKPLTDKTKFVWWPIGEIGMSKEEV